MNNKRAISSAIQITRCKQFAIWVELVKLRLTMMVLITTAMGFYLASANTFNWLLLFHVLLGTGLLACGAAALNQYLETDFDAKMPRTTNRPIPAGHIRPEKALLAGGAMAAIGLVYLAMQVNPTTSVIGAVTLVSYVAVYTPLKQVTSFNTLVGAIPGALPPLMGWTAAGGAQAAITVEGLALVAILLFWQLPHFLAISWIYKGEYARADFVMLAVEDEAGVRTGRHAAGHVLVLLLASALPFALGMAGIFYLVGAMALGAYFLIQALRFSRKRTVDEARFLGRRIDYSDGSGLNRCALRPN